MVQVWPREVPRYCFIPVYFVAVLMCLEKYTSLIFIRILHSQRLNICRSKFSRTILPSSLLNYYTLRKLITIRAIHIPRKRHTYCRENQFALDHRELKVNRYSLYTESCASSAVLYVHHTNQHETSFLTAREYIFIVVSSTGINLRMWTTGIYGRCTRARYMLPN
jgi:hypothetical protein